jgi:hypothetical protein
MGLPPQAGSVRRAPSLISNGGNAARSGVGIAPSVAVQCAKGTFKCNQPIVYDDAVLVDKDDGPNPRSLVCGCLQTMDSLGNPVSLMVPVSVRETEIKP